LLRRTCELIEQETGKGRLKWVDAAPRRRSAYIQQVLTKPIFRDKLSFAVYQNSRDYATLTIETVARTLNADPPMAYQATVLIDALPRSLERIVGLRLRRSGVPAKKVRGVKKDENDALIRLADAVCGFVRAAVEGTSQLHPLLDRAIQAGFRRDLSRK